MYRVILLASLFPIYTFAITSDLKKQYDEFQTTYSKTLEISKNKNLFSKEFDSITKKLKLKYEIFAKYEKTDLSAEGHQMALDIEMLEPLEFLATSRINKESCSEAHLLNDMNSTSDTNTYKKIKKTLQVLCQ